MIENARRVTIDTPVSFHDDLPDTVDVVIIGAGVIGTFAALYLARAGYRVLVCEKGRVAGEQSSRNWGWIRQQGRDAAELPIMMKSLWLWHEANRETHGRCGVTTCGTYYLASTSRELESHLSWLPDAHGHGLRSRELTRHELQSTFGVAAAGRWQGGIVTPSDARGEPWRAVPAVARLAQNEGAGFRENCAVRGLDVTAGQVTGVITEQGPVRCEQVVLAGGAWSSLFARRHGISIPQLLVRGTVVQTTKLPEFFSGAATDEHLAIRRRDDEAYTLSLAERHTYFLGRQGLRHLAKFLPILRQSWRSIEFRAKSPAGFPDAWGVDDSWSMDGLTPFEATRVLEPPVSHRDVSRICDLFGERFPAEGRPGVQTAWAGMIDAMPDVVPIVDRVPDLPGLVIATGMSGHGFGIGPGFGHIIASLVAGQVHEFDLERFRFARFHDGSPLVVGPAL